MTIAALLSHFNIAQPRFVTVNGQVVFDGVTRLEGGGHTHATLGAVTPVVPHKFHGGEDVPDAEERDGELSVWWNDSAEISRHVEAMTLAFPAFVYVPADGHLAPCWIGDVDTGRGRFTVGIILRRDRGLPGVAVLSRKRVGAQRGRKWERSPHLYDSGNLCVADQADYDPDVHTAATAAAWAAHWLAAYTEWVFTKKWPCDGVTVSAA